MKKFSLLFLLIIIASFAFLFSCEDSGSGDDEGTEAISLGNTLTISSETITHTFTIATSTWAENFTHTDTDNYSLVSTTGGGDDGAPVDTDTSNDAVLDLTTGIPADINMVTASDWGFNSSESGILLYSVKVQDTSATEFTYYEGNFSGVPAQWYEYIYSSGKTTLSGTAIDGSESYTFDDVILSAGWNKIISKTSNGEDFTYKGGSISGVKWTQMIE